MSHVSRLKRRTTAVLAALMLASVMTVAASAQPAAARSDVSFEGWTFDFDAKRANFDGLALNNVSYNGIQILERISLPTMNVFYIPGVCGPYVDRLTQTNFDGPFAEEFTQNGVRWYSIGITAYVGAYVITQMFYLSEHGELDAHIFSKGLQCNTNHIHLPFWRIDFAIDGDANDVVSSLKPNGTVWTASREFSTFASNAVDHEWEVRDTITGNSVSIDFDDGSFDVGGKVIPEDHYTNNKVFARQYKPEEERWLGGASYSLFGNESEEIDNLVLWYSGYMPHITTEDPEWWHSTGIRITVNQFADLGVDTTYLDDHGWIGLGAVEAADLPDGWIPANTRIEKIKFDQTIPDENQTAFYHSDLLYEGVAFEIEDNVVSFTEPVRALSDSLGMWFYAPGFSPTVATVFFEYVAPPSSKPGCVPHPKNNCLVVGLDASLD